MKTKIRYVTEDDAEFASIEEANIHQDTINTQYLRLKVKAEIDAALSGTGDDDLAVGIESAARIIARRRAKQEGKIAGASKFVAIDDKIFDCLGDAERHNASVVCGLIYCSSENHIKQALRDDYPALADTILMAARMIAKRRAAIAGESGAGAGDAGPKMRINPAFGDSDD